MKKSMWRNKGSILRLHGKIIKPNQVFEAYLDEIPKPFRDALELIEPSNEINQTIQTIKTNKPTQTKSSLDIWGTVLAIGTLYNELKYLPDMIKYWQAQGISMYYIDNYSTDGTWEYLQKQGIPSHQFSTNKTFDLFSLQREIEKTLHKLKPTWFIYSSADLYFAMDRPIKTILNLLQGQGINQVKLPCFTFHNTGEKRGPSFFGRYYYSSIRKKPLTMISRYHKDIGLTGDNITIPGSRCVEVNGCMINFGQTKSVRDRNITARRRQKAWDNGLNKRWGAHYIEGKNKKWLWDKEDLLDIRKTNEYKYYEQMRYLVAGIADMRTKITFVSQKDYAGSAWRIVHQLRLSFNDKYNIQAITKEDNVYGGIPCGWTIEKYGKYATQQRITETDILHIKGDWPVQGDWEGFIIPPHVKRVHLVSGSFFRRKAAHLTPNVSLQRFAEEEYHADFKAATTPDLIYNDDWHYMPFSYSNFHNYFEPAPGNKFRIVHIPSSPNKKGTDRIQEAARLLCAKRNDVEYIELTGIPFAQVKEETRKAHIYIDQLVIDAYSNASVVAMANGIPVCSGINPDLYNDTPVVALPADPQGVADTLESLLNWDNLLLLSKKTFEYAKNIHGSMAADWDIVYTVLSPPIKVGVLIPTCEPARKPFVDFLLDRIKKQTYQPDEIKVVNYPNKTGKSDLTKRYKEGCTALFEKGVSLVVFMEDDDYYPLNYLENMVQAWKQNGKPAVIGHAPTRYYHLDGMYKEYGVLPHCSAHGTAVSKQANLHVCDDTDISFDIALWKYNQNKVQVTLADFPVSIKHGIGCTIRRKWHEPEMYTKSNNTLNTKSDLGKQVLKKWVDPEAYKFYETLVR